MDALPADYIAKVKAYRSRTGCGLHEATRAVKRDRIRELVEMSSADPELRAAVALLLDLL